MKSFWSLWATFFGVIVLWPDDAHAYLDPGTGSMMLQMAIAGIVSALFVLKIFWRRIVDLVSRLIKKSQ